MTDERGTDLGREAINYNEMTGDLVEDAIRKLCLMVKLTRMTPSPTLDQINEFMVVAEKDIRNSFAALEPEFQQRERAAKWEVFLELEAEGYDTLVCHGDSYDLYTPTDEWFNRYYKGEDAATANTADRTEEG